MPHYDLSARLRKRLVYQVNIRHTSSKCRAQMQTHSVPFCLEFDVYELVNAIEIESLQRETRYIFTWSCRVIKADRNSTDSVPTTEVEQTLLNKKKRR